MVIGICDDNREDAIRIQQEVCKCLKLFGEEKTITMISEDGRKLLENCRTKMVNLIFLDLEMPECNGFELAEQIYDFNPAIKIIFVSNHENMVFDSYEYAPLWFVRKSFMERDMLKAVQKYLKTESKVQIWCKDGEKSKDIWFCINEVLYIECRGHTLFIYTKNEECHKIYGSLKSLEEKLLVYGFIRIHKNFLVNARCVKEIGNRTVCLLDGMELDIGKNRRKQIKQQLENYKGGCVKITDYLINGLSSVIALEYISHGLKQKYSGYCGTVLFLMGCTAYFFVVTGLNHYTSFEGALGIGYGVVLYVYCLLAAEGRKSDFFLLSVVWVLLAFISAYVMFAVWGMFSGGSLEELLKTESQAHMYFSLSAGALRFSMGRIVLAVYQRRKQKKILAEDWLMAVTFLIFFFLILFMFRLECGGLGQKERYHLSLWILFGIFLAIILLGGFYQLIGKYRIEKIEDEYQKENQKLQEEQIHNLFQLGREANRLRHDMSAKVNVVYGLLRKQAYKEAEESLKRIADEWEDYLEIPEETGNEGLNAALIRAIHECREKDIRFHYAVLGNVSGVDSLDMGNLIHNLLKNGIEACDQVKGERELEIVIGRDGCMVEIDIDNTIQDSVMELNPSFKTSKIEKEKHGFGMETIQRIVDDYQGSYFVWEEGKRLLQRITLKIREIEE